MQSRQVPLGSIQYAGLDKYGLEILECLKLGALGFRASQSLSLGLQQNGY